jgi:cleavage stimulation factor subunit 1
MKWSPNANMYVTSSKDGDIKLWDGVGNVVINTFTKAHDGNEVCSVAFSRNGKVCVVKCSQVFSCFFL